ncbi:MAG: ribonuclease P protein component [Sandaracinus sp.]
MGEGTLGKERLLAQDRLKLRRDFERVQSRGRKVHSARFLFLVLGREGASGAEPARLGLTVTRKVANAVGRNRIKRVLREVFRKNRRFFPLGCDVVIVAKDRAVGLGYEDTREEIERTSAALLRAGGPPPDRAAPPRTSRQGNQEESARVRGSGTNGRERS